MAAPPPPPPPPARGGLSLYDNLQDPNDPSSDAATISSAPVRYGQGRDDPASADSAKKPAPTSFFFQPTIRRPQTKQPKSKATFPKSIPNPSSAPALSKPPTAPVQPPKTSLADWAATEEDEWRYGAGEKHQRGGRRKKKRKQEEVAETDWDDLYDPSRPTDVEEYLRSDEKINEVRDWKSLLYKHKKRIEESDLSSDEDNARPSMSNQFAPPQAYGFAPPPQSPPSHAPIAARFGDADDTSPPPRPIPSQAQYPPPPPSPPTIPAADIPQPPPEFPAPINSSATISAAPVRYAQPQSPSPSSPPAPLNEPSSEDPDASAPRSSRPGQSGFATRLMSKYGWTAGTGLGASSTGIVNPLRVQVEKRRRKADADGGGWAEWGGKGKIIDGSSGGARRKRDEDDDNGQEGGKFGPMSEVIVLRNMLDGMPDLQHEIGEGLGQEIGEECGEKYGRVERLYIDQENRQVFIKFTDQVSALRAVNELDGRIFNGNTILPRFYDTERFERGAYV